MENYDSFAFKTGQYGIQEIRKYVDEGLVSKEDAEWRIENLGGMLANDVREILLNKKGPSDIEAAIAKYIEFEKELFVYYTHGLVSDEFAKKRMADKKTNPFENHLIYSTGLVDASSA